jgi:hypothetical protein
MQSGRDKDRVSNITPSKCAGDRTKHTDTPYLSCKGFTLSMLGADTTLVNTQF